MSAVGWVRSEKLLGGPLFARYLAGEPVGVAGSERRCPDLAALVARGRSRLGRAPDRALVDALGRSLASLSAPRACLEHLERLGRGEVVLVFAGQQPGLLGGPLYTLHKALTAQALARAITRAGVPAVAAFWIASDDADLDEAGAVYAPGADRSLKKAAISRAYPPGTIAGNVHAEESDAALAALFEGAHERLGAFHAKARECARDLGDLSAALLLELVGSDGLLVVDSRLSELREASRPIVERYIATHETVRARVDAAGDALEAAGETRPIHPRSSASALFAVDESGVRAKLDAPTDAERCDAASLSPGVVLRPFVQEGVFPTAAMVVGPGELRYLLQTESASETLGVERAPFFPRFSATWADPALVSLAGSEANGWCELFEDPRPRIRRRLAKRLPVGLGDALSSLRTSLEEGFDRLVRAGEADGSLAQITEAARKKIEYQLGRIESQVLDRARREAAKEGLVLVNVSDFLLPRRGPQERSFAFVWPISYLEPAAFARRARAAAESHVARVFTREAGHAIVPLDPDATVTEEEAWSASCESA